MTGNQIGILLCVVGAIIDLAILVLILDMRRCRIAGMTPGYQPRHTQWNETNRAVTYIEHDGQRIMFIQRPRVRITIHQMRLLSVSLVDANQWELEYAIGVGDWGWGKTT